MLCLKCGATNSGTTLSCANCGSPLDQQPWFAPIAHSPFNALPLPQASEPLPTLIQPVGEIVTFTPTSQVSLSPEHLTFPGPPPVTVPPATFSDLADYPTETRMPVPSTPHGLTGHPAPLMAAQEAEAVAYPEDVNAQYSPVAPSSPYASPRTAGQDNGNHLAMHEEESYAALFHTPPAAQTPGNVYPSPLNNAFAGTQAQSAASLAPGQFLTPEANRFVRPLPLWAFVLDTAAGTLLLAALVFLNPDWASGAMIAGLVAIILAMLLLIAGGVRVALGLLAQTNSHRRSQVISTTLLVLLLFLFGGIGLTQQIGLHAMQARYLEGQHSWATAISEYQSAGETTPTSENLARVYNEWGEALSGQQQYASAIMKFSTVLEHYALVKDQVSRARSDIVATYLAGADNAARHQNYTSAVTSYDTLLALSYCSASCQALARTKDATTYYDLAEQQLGTQQFARAVSAFAALTTRFASSPEAKQAQTHEDYAKALWGLGQQQLNTTCSNAVNTYQQLAQHFADTSQGKLAATALRQPVPVKGHFTETIPGPPYHPTISLVQGLFVGIQQYQFPSLLRANLTTQINSDGTFTLSSVPQGTYELVWSSDGTLHFYYASNGNQVLYTAHIGPLCTYNYGNINQAIPTSN